MHASFYLFVFFLTKKYKGKQLETCQAGEIIHQNKEARGRCGDFSNTEPLILPLKNHTTG